MIEGLKIRKFNAAMPGGVGVLMRLADAGKEGSFEQFAVMVDLLLDLVEEPTDKDKARELVMGLSIDELQGFFAQTTTE